RVSVSSTGDQGDGDSFGGAVSSDGNLIAFDSSASTLVPGDTNGASDVFVRDVAAGTTTRISVSSSGRQAKLESFGPTISADGNVVAFTSRARLDPSDTNHRFDVYAYDLSTGQVTLVSVSSRGDRGNDDSFAESVS